MSLVASHLPCPDCGSSDALAEYADNTYCFSCHRTKRKKSESSFAAVMEDVGYDQGTSGVPRSFTAKIPPAGMKWLWKYGITDEQIELYGIGYAKHGSFMSNSGSRVTFEDRLIIPEYQNGEFKFYQARALKDEDPKYYTAGSKKTMFFSKQAETDYIVLVEDMISAIKVGSVAKSASLLGTKIIDDQVLTLVRKYDTIVVWLDGDEAGQKGSKAIAGRLSLMADVVEIETASDPKCYHENEIEKLLEIALD